MQLPPDSNESYMSTKICFRGDRRDPAKIFSTGFKRRITNVWSKKNNTTQVPLGHDQKGKARMARFRDDRGDMEPGTCVCISARMEIATMFPLRYTSPPTAFIDHGKHACTWIYTVQVDTSNLFNSHQHQWKSGNLALLFGHELAVYEVPPEDVICAIHNVNRTGMEGTGDIQGATNFLNQRSNTIQNGNPTNSRRF